MLSGDKLMPALHVKEQRFTYKNELDKACFAHDVAYANSKDLAKGTVSDKVFKDRTYEFPLNPKYDRYQSGLASMIYKFF